MWPFKEKEKTPEEKLNKLLKKCNKGYSDFKFSLTLAHTHDYYLFKRDLLADFDYMKLAITVSEDVGNTQLTIDLLTHFEKQLKFINENPFLAKMDKFEQFLAENYPYKDKIDSIIQANKVVKKTALTR